MLQPKSPALSFGHGRPEGLSIAKSADVTKPGATQRSAAAAVRPQLLTSVGQRRRVFDSVGHGHPFADRIRPRRKSWRRATEPEEWGAQGSVESNHPQRTVGGYDLRFVMTSVSL